MSQKPTVGRIVHYTKGGRQHAAIITDVDPFHEGVVTIKVMLPKGVKDIRNVDYSPTGLEWGYGGSGPADLALNILLKYGVAQEWAERWHQKFKFDVVCRIPKEGAVIPGADIRAWIQNQAKEAALI